MQQLQQQQQLQLHQHQQASAAAAAGPAYKHNLDQEQDESTVWWNDDMLDLSTVELKALLATMPGLRPELIDQLKVARRKKRNRMYARRSRQRRQSGSSDQPARVQYSQMIGALRTSNTALRSSLDTSRQSSTGLPLSAGY
jgi:outer membrane receptor for Fe3+-dicitrate